MAGVATPVYLCFLTTALDARLLHLTVTVVSLRLRPVRCVAYRIEQANEQLVDVLVVHRFILLPVCPPARGWLLLYWTHIGRSAATPASNA